MGEILARWLPPVTQFTEAHTLEFSSTYYTVMGGDMSQAGGKNLRF
jgi:hypothetical protein